MLRRVLYIPGTPGLDGGPGWVERTWVSKRGTKGSVVVVVLFRTSVLSLIDMLDTLF